MQGKYEEIRPWSREDIDKALRDDDSKALAYAVVAVSIYEKDWHYAQDLCVRLSSHSHSNVRGNAILGFGHISRVHGQLDQTIVQPIIEAALRDPNNYVRGHAFDAADDTAHFLGWRYTKTSEQ